MTDRDIKPDDIRKLAASILAHDCVATQRPWRWADWSQTFGRMENPDRMLWLEAGHRTGESPEPCVRMRDEDSTSVLRVEDDLENQANKALIPAFRNGAPVLAEFALAVLDTLDTWDSERYREMNDAAYDFRAAIASRMADKEPA